MKKLIIIALSVSLFACNKEDKKTKDDEAEILFPLTLGNEWYYKVTNGSVDFDTIRIDSYFTMEDLIKIEQNSNGLFRNKEIVNKYRWISTPYFLSPQLANTGNYTISGLDADNDYNLFVTPLLKKVDSDEEFYTKVTGTEVQKRFASSNMESINGYSAFKVLHYTLNYGDTILKAEYYISPGIGIVRMKQWSGQHDLVGYKLN